MACGTGCSDVFQHAQFNVRTAWWDIQYQRAVLKLTAKRAPGLERKYTKLNLDPSVPSLWLTDVCLNGLQTSRNEKLINSQALSMCCNS